MTDPITQTPAQDQPAQSQFGTAMVPVSPSGDQILSGVTVAQANLLLTIASGNYVSILQLAYPVGSIYISNNAISPAVLFGFGTWIEFGAGRVPVGFDSGQVEFDTDEETGGEKTHTLTTAEMPSHTHDLGVIALNTTTGGASQRFNANNVGSAGNPSGSAGSDGAHNNLQPYIVIRMWKRTA